MNAAALFVQPPQDKMLTTNRNKEFDEIVVKLQRYLLTEKTGNAENLGKILIQEFKDYNYKIYRCASKFVILQKLFNTSNIPFQLISAILSRHGISSDANINLMIVPFQLTAIIHDIYFAAEKFGHFTVNNFQLNIAVTALANFFWNIFDQRRRHSTSLLEIKVTFLLLCKNFHSDELVTEFFHLLADKRTNVVTKFNFKYFLEILTKIITYIGEGDAYGAQHINSIVQECFSKFYNGKDLIEYQFHCLWKTTKTSFRIYANLIELIKRIQDTEKLVHSNECPSCHIKNIIGIRFRCQKCKNFSLCLKCFATGYTNSTHNRGHQMLEVFTEDSPPKTFSHYFAKFCSTFCSSDQLQDDHDTSNTTRANEKEDDRHESASNSNETINTNVTVLKTLPSISQQQADIERHLESYKNRFEPSLQGLSATANNASIASQKMQSIIHRLIHQNVKLELLLKNIHSISDSRLYEFLTGHQKFLIDIIQEMRNFPHICQPSLLQSHLVSSTPNLLKPNSAKFDSMNFSATSRLSQSINGADLNRSYLEANRSDYSLKDISFWFSANRKTMPSIMPAYNTRRGTETICQQETNADENNETSQLSNLNRLLAKVHEMIEEVYDNSEEMELSRIEQLKDVSDNNNTNTNNNGEN